MADLEFDVTVSTSVPLDQLEPATREAVQQLIDAARDAALNLLAGAVVAPADASPEAKEEA